MATFKKAFFKGYGSWQKIIGKVKKNGKPMVC